MQRARASAMATTTDPRVHTLHEDASGQPSSSATAPRWRTRLRTLGLALVLSAAMAGGGYVAGRVHAWTAAREAQAQLQVAVDEHQRAFAKAESQHRGELAQVRAELAHSGEVAARLTQSAALLEALRSTNHAVRALDERNFGVADAARRSARDVLAPLAGAVPELPEIVAKLEALELVVATDSGAQRRELLSILDLLEPVVDRTNVAPSVAPSAAPSP